MGYAPIIRNSYTDDVIRTKKFDEVCLLYSINLYKDFKKGSKPLFKVIGTDKNMFFNKVNDLKDKFDVKYISGSSYTTIPINDKEIYYNPIVTYFETGEVYTD